jgi:hypothetical protein
MALTIHPSIKISHPSPTVAATSPPFPSLNLAATGVEAKVLIPNGTEVAAGRSCQVATELQGTRCYQKHPPLSLGQYTIYGGNAARPIVKGADVYVTLQEGMSCGLATNVWDVSKWDISAVPPEFGQDKVEAIFPIPDGNAPGDFERFNYLITWLCNQPGKQIHVGCIGGHGRTGTVLTALVAELVGERDAIQYVRTHYCHKAVESKSQSNFLIKHYGVLAAEAWRSPARKSRR